MLSEVFFDRPVKPIKPNSFNYCKCFPCIAAVVKLEAPRLTSILSDTTVTVRLFPLASSPRDHVTHYYIAVVPANLRVSSNDVRLDEVRSCYSFRIHHS